MTKVAVIVPNYNHAPYLAQRIDTILAQRFDDFELIILDDASADDSREVARRYSGDRRVRFDFSALNSGNPYRQWRRGLDQSTSDYVWIAESDDYAEPTLLEELAAQLDAHPAAGMAVCASDVVDEAGRFLHRFFDTWHGNRFLAPYIPDFGDAPLAIEGKVYSRYYMHPWNSIPNASAVLFRRAAFDAIGGPVETLRLCGDWMTYCRMLMEFDIVRIPGRLNHFRSHDGNVRRRTKASTFVCEAMAVQRYVEDALDLRVDAGRRRHMRGFMCQALIAPARRLLDSKVPPSEIGAILANASGFGPAILAGTASILLQEQVSTLARPLINWSGLRRSG
ncbi:glycosyltransferase family 2 protein [Rhizorhabdus argentea]|uniref:glycosyltransferase family 2 protein n=1 Tax=Rhizorhabdus argentea TaxID=1387174 RepID=UPI0030EB654A